MPSKLEQGVIFLNNLGVFDVVLPFILIFTIVFAVLRKTKIFGKGKTKINIIISFIVGFILLLFEDIILKINQILPYIALLILGFFLIQLLLGFTGSKLKNNNWLTIIILIILFIIIAPILGFDLNEILNQVIDIITTPLIISLVVFILVRSEEHTSELQSHSFISYAVFCLKKKTIMQSV